MLKKVLQTTTGPRMRALWPDWRNAATTNSNDDNSGPGGPVQLAGDSPDEATDWTPGGQQPSVFKAVGFCAEGR